MSMQLGAEELNARADALFNQFKMRASDPSGRLLVVGGGTGANAARFGSAFDDVHCCDIALRLLEDSGMSVVQADGRQLPYPDDSMDAAIAVSVIEHVLPFEDRPRLIAELVRVTKPTGTVFLQIPNNRFPVQWIK